MSNERGNYLVYEITHGYPFDIWGDGTGNLSNDRQSGEVSDESRRQCRVSGDAATRAGVYCDQVTITVTN